LSGAALGGVAFGMRIVMPMAAALTCGAVTRMIVH